MAKVKEKRTYEPRRSKANKVQKKKPKQKGGKKLPSRHKKKGRDQNAKTSEPLPIVKIRLGPSTKGRSVDVFPIDPFRKKIYVYENYGEVDEAGRPAMEKKIKGKLRKQRRQNPESAQHIASLLQSYGIEDSDGEKEVKKDPEYTKEFPSIDEGLVEESKSKSRKKEKQDLERKERAAEVAAKTQTKLEKKDAKASKSKDDSKVEEKLVIHGLTPPKPIQALTVATLSKVQESPEEDALPEENKLALMVPDKKEVKQLKRLDKIKRREDKTVAISRPKTLEKLTGLLNKRDGKYSGAKFAALLDLAEKILAVDQIPGGTLEQKANKVRKDIKDLVEDTTMQEPEIETEKALVLREVSPDCSPEPEIEKALVLREASPESHPDADESLLKNTSTDTLAPLKSGKIVSCQWKKCGKKFSTPMTLFFHVSDEHIGRSKKKLTLECAWDNCETNTTEHSSKAAILSHLKDRHIPVKEQSNCDFCDWAGTETSELKKHMKSQHPDQLTSIPEAVVLTGAQKRKRSHDEEENPEKPSKRVKFGSDVKPGSEELANPKQKQKKRKHEEEAAVPQSDADPSQRPVKKMKKSKKH